MNTLKTTSVTNADNIDIYAMILFKKKYNLDLNKNKLNLEYLEVNQLDEIYNIEIEVFEIEALTYFNTVVARFEKNFTKNDVLLRIELPKRSQYLLLISCVILLTMTIGFTYTNDFNTNQYFRCIVYVFPILIVFGIVIYQYQFLKGVKNFLNEIILPDEK